MLLTKITETDRPTIRKEVMTERFYEKLQLLLAMRSRQLRVHLFARMHTGHICFPILIFHKVLQQRVRGVVGYI